MASVATSSNPSSSSHQRKDTAVRVVQSLPDPADDPDDHVDDLLREQMETALVLDDPDNMENVPAAPKLQKVPSAGSDRFAGFTSYRFNAGAPPVNTTTPMFVRPLPQVTGNARHAVQAPSPATNAYHNYSGPGSPAFSESPGTPASPAHAGFSHLLFSPLPSPIPSGSAAVFQNPHFNHLHGPIHRPQAPSVYSHGSSGITDMTTASTAATSSALPSPLPHATFAGAAAAAAMNSAAAAAGFSTSSTLPSPGFHPKNPQTLIRSAPATPVQRQSLEAAPKPKPQQAHGLAQIAESSSATSTPLSSAKTHITTSLSQPLRAPSASEVAAMAIPRYMPPGIRRRAMTVSTPGRKLDDYDLLDTIGTGTFGRVYLCRSKQGNPDVYYAMKVLKKVDIVRLKQVEHINSEKQILAGVRHPFIVNLYVAYSLYKLCRFCTFQDETNLYMLMEYVLGGELFTHLRRAGRFSNEVTRFYAAEIVLALEYLHSRDVVYRDLKPENLLLDKEGHVKITDFGFAKRVEDRTWTLCGTPEYLAPEIIQSKGHGKAVDWWALGILTFEMLAGYPPFFDDNPFGIYEKILAGRIQFPTHFHVHAKDFIRRLLTADRVQRLGNLRGGAGDVKRHKWFRGVDWDGLKARTVRSPIQPRYRHPGDTGNFEKYPETRRERPTPGAPDPYRHLFLDF
jgi:serine/threonine protein kinase